MTTKQPITSRLLNLIVGKQRGAASVQELQRARQVVRLGVVFSVTILLPALVLSYLALSTLSSVERQVDDEYHTRAETIAEEVEQEIVGVFARFEDATTRRLAMGESPLVRISDLSPHLRGAYQFDLEGQLIAPFELARANAQPTPPQHYQALMAEARALVRNDQDQEAAPLFALASSAAREPVHQAEARLAEARAWAALGHPSIADELLTTLHADHANVRGSRGFRFDHLSLLLRAELAMTSDPKQKGPRAYRELTDKLLDARWSVGESGEATMVSHTLAILARSADQAWVNDRRARLRERKSQLTWSNLISREIDLVGSGAPQTARWSNLPARFDSPSVWEIYATDRGVYAFSFSLEALETELAAAIDLINAREHNVTTSLLNIGDPLPKGALWTLPLPPPLSSVLRVSVAQTHPGEVARLKQLRTRTWGAIVLTSVLLVGFGVFLSARTIAHEIENVRVKADFAANVSHELRSPITQIRLKGEALLFGLVDPGDDTIEHYSAIVREAERLSRLVDNVLDFAAIERGAKSYHLRRDDLIAVVWTTVESHRSAIEDRGLEIELDLPDDLSPVWMDRDAIGQVIVNLLSNAAKYGQSGGWVGISIQQSNNSITLSVSDRGLGISTADQERIFDHFFRSTDPNVRKKKGTGIGLSIVSYIVDAHGATISVESTPLKGTSFTVTFPLEPPAGAGVNA